MKVLKKLFCIILVLAMAVPFANIGAYAFSDVEDSHQYAKPISSLVSLGLLAGYAEDGTFRPDNTITRAEFATVITRALGMDKHIVNSDISYIFTDMTSPDGDIHWGSGYVKFAYDKGIIKGMGDNTFAPDAPVTFEQAVKMIVCTLGYTSTAEEKGGWPMGYIETASGLGITKDAAVPSSDSPASRGVVAQLLYNSLEVEILNETSNTKKTILNDVLGIKEFKNYMLTNVDGSVTVSSTATNVKKGQILLEKGTEKLVIAYGDVETSDAFKNCMGYFISGYYKTDSDGENTLVSVSLSSSKNKEIEIESDDIESFSGLKIEYNINSGKFGKTEKIAIASDAQLVYNGRVYNYKTSANPSERDLSLWLDPSSADFIYGSVRLLDSNNDSYYESIFIEDYDVYVVKSSVSTKDSIANNNYIVYDYYNTGKSVRLDKLDDTLVIMIEDSKTGKEVKIEDLRAMNVLSVAPSKDNTMFVCKAAVSKTIEGKISQKSSTKHIYTINQIDYKVTPEMEQLITGGKIELDVGTIGTYYLDHKGRIAAVKITEEKIGEYGYITIGAMTGASRSTATVKIISFNGSSDAVKMNLAENVKINGKTYDNASLALSKIEAVAAEITANAEAGVTNAGQAQLVRFVKNSKGEISSLTIISTDSSGNIKLGKSMENGDLVMGSQKSTLKYTGSGKFGNEIFANSSTKVLVVPDDRNNEKGYKQYTGLSIFTSSASYDVEAYNISQAGIASVLLVYNLDTSKPIKDETPIAIIEAKMNAINPETGDSCYMFEVSEGSYLKEYYTINASSTFADLSVGDVVRFGYDSEGFINAVRVEADLSNLVANTYNGTDRYNGDWKFKTILGTVSSKSDELIKIAPKKIQSATDGETTTYTLDDTNQEGYAKNDSVQIYRIVVKAGSEAKIESPTWESIVSFEDVKDNTASVAFAYVYMNKLKLIVVYVGDVTLTEPIE